MYEKLKSKRFTEVLKYRPSIVFFYVCCVDDLCWSLYVDDAVLNQTQRVLKVIDQNQ